MIVNGKLDMIQDQTVPMYFIRFEEFSKAIKNSHNGG